jgi:hypothetical protein
VASRDFPAALLDAPGGVLVADACWLLERIIRAIAGLIELLAHLLT